MLTVLHTSQIAIGHTRPSHCVTVFTRRCLVAAFNCGRSPSCGFRTVPGLSYQLLTVVAHNNWIPAVMWLHQKSQSSVTTDSQSASPSWCLVSEAQDQIFVTVRQLRILLMWDSLSDERTSLLLALDNAVIYRHENRQFIYSYIYNFTCRHFTYKLLPVRFLVDTVYSSTCKPSIMYVCNVCMYVCTMHMGFQMYAWQQGHTYMQLLQLPTEPIALPCNTIRIEC
jgi:hypothetical protein